ncbi:MAG: hypothetical protein ACTSXU_05200 [Promethearchaeota archaeon]
MVLLAMYKEISLYIKANPFNSRQEIIGQKSGLGGKPGLNIMKIIPPRP